MSTFTALATLLALLAPASAWNGGKISSKPSRAHVSTITSCSTVYASYRTNWVPTSTIYKTNSAHPTKKPSSSHHHKTTGKSTKKHTGTKKSSKTIKVTKTKTRVTTSPSKTLTHTSTVTATDLCLRQPCATPPTFTYLTTITTTRAGGTSTVTLPTVTSTVVPAGFSFPPSGPTARIRKRNNGSTGKYPNKVFCTVEVEPIRSGKPVTKSKTSKPVLVNLTSNLFHHTTKPGKLRSTTKTKSSKLSIKTVTSKKARTTGKGLVVPTISTVPLSNPATVATPTVSQTATVILQSSATVTIQPSATVVAYCGSANQVGSNPAGTPLNFLGSNFGGTTTSASSAADCCKTCFAAGSGTTCAGSRYNPSTNECTIYELETCPANQSQLVGTYAATGLTMLDANVFSNGPCGHWEYNNGG